jgi:hypothetical protein
VNKPTDMWKFVNKTDSCWVWTGSKSRQGYGQFTVNYKNWRVHRLSYWLKNGNLPDILVLDHLCRNKLCVNPDHLELVTNKENVMRGIGVTAKNARKTHCKRGHRFTPQTIYVPPKWQTIRACKLCRAETQRIRIAKRNQLKREAGE